MLVMRAVVDPRRLPGRIAMSSADANSAFLNWQRAISCSKTAVESSEQSMARSRSEVVKEISLPSWYREMTPGLLGTAVRSNDSAACHHVSWPWPGSEPTSDCHHASALANPWPSQPSRAAVCASKSSSNAVGDVGSATRFT